MLPRGSCVDVWVTLTNGQTALHAIEPTSTAKRTYEAAADGLVEVVVEYRGPGAVPHVRDVREVA
jgi:hypothetical protein